MNTSERLAAHAAFDEEVLGRVQETAEMQNRLSFRDLTRSYGVESGPQRVPIGDDGRYLEVLEFTPKDDHDHGYARVYNMSMGNTINPALTMNLMRLFGSDPTSRLVMVGNPSVPGHAGGTVSASEAYEMVKDSTLRPVARPVIQYLAAAGITRSAQLGFSYGVDKAAVVSGMAPDYNHEIDKGVFVEPVSVVAHGVRRLMARFGASNKEMPGYIKRTDSPPYYEARSTDSLLGLLGYGAGLARATNVAIVPVLARGGYEQRLRGALKANPDAVFTTAWGSSSELTIDEAATQMCERVEADEPNARHFRVLGMHHAGGDDIDLHTAIMLQGLKA